MPVSDRCLLTSLLAGVIQAPYSMPELTRAARQPHFVRSDLNVYDFEGLTSLAGRRCSRIAPISLPWASITEALHEAMDMIQRYLPLLICLLLLGVELASANPPNSREREMLRRAQRQMQDLQSQLASLQQDKAKLAQEQAQTTREVASTRDRLRRAQHALTTEKAAHETTRAELEQSGKELAALRERLTATAATLSDTRAALAASEAKLARAEANIRELQALKTRQEREIALCEDKNMKLYQTGRELMTRFEQKTCGEILAQKEPFLGLKRVEIENLLEEYRDKLDADRLIKPPGGG